MASEQMVERAAAVIQEWLQTTAERAIAALMDDGRAPFAAKTTSAEQLAFFVDTVHSVGLIGPDGQINPEARAFLVTKYGEAGYTQMLEALNTARAKLLREATPASSSPVPGSLPIVPTPQGNVTSDLGGVTPPPRGVFAPGNTLTS